MDELDVRVWALDRAIKEAPSGTAWEVIFKLASRYEKYILTGQWDDPNAPKPAAIAEHDFVPERSHKSRCIICSKLYGEGNHS
jgi:hypothetical protein